jgi:hypothetical protein
MASTSATPARYSQIRGKNASLGLDVARTELRPAKSHSLAAESAQLLSVAQAREAKSRPAVSNASLTEGKTLGGSTGVREYTTPPSYPHHARLQPM